MCPVHAAVFSAAPLLGIVASDRFVKLSCADLVAVVRDDEVIAPLEIDELVEVVEHLNALIVLVVHPKHLIEPEASVRVMIAASVD